MSRQVETKVKKRITCKVSCSEGRIKLKFPKQTVGSLALMFEKKSGDPIVIRQWDLVIHKDDLKVVRLK